MLVAENHHTWLISPRTSQPIGSPKISPQYLFYFHNVAKMISRSLASIVPFTVQGYFGQGNNRARRWMMNAIKIKWMAVMMMTAALALAGLPLFGQGNAETSTGVARVSLIRGNVSMERGDSNEWVAVTVNTPLVPGDTLATGAGSRAEVQLDYSNVVRLADNSEVKIADLNDSRIQLQVARGTVDLAVFQNNQANSEVDTPNVAVAPLQPGTYRIDVNSDSLSLVTVRDGQAQISTPQGSTNINAGQQITVEGAQNPQYQIVDARPLDNWDTWNRDRNSVIDSAQNYAHVNQYYTGAQDLDTSGRWTYVPGYDWCWTPYVDAGWVPYSNGRWVWEPYYGWTWVSYDPWGWAPYHYGRWFYYGSSWCWWPGAVTPFYRPLWAPAYVSFFGFGYGRYHFSFGYGYGFRSIGWCPLGPRDEFHRWWGRGRDHSFNAINFNNHYGRGGRGYRGSNLAELGSNFHLRRGIVTMSSDRFGREAVPRNRGVVTTAMLRNADVVHGTLPVVPTRASLRVTNRNAVVSAAARSRANNTHFFTRSTVAVRNSNHSFNTQASSVRRMVETRNVRAAGTNRAGTSAEANRGFSMSRSSASQNQSGEVRRNPAPVVRENAQGRQSFGAANGRSTEASQSNFRRFGTGAPTAQSRSYQNRQNSAPVVRGNLREAPNQSTQRFNQGGNPSVRSQQNNSGFRQFSPQPGPRSAPQNEGRFNNNSRAEPRNYNGNQSGWNRFQPQTQSPQQRGGAFYNNGSRTQGYSQPRYQGQPSYNNSRNYSRPPLRFNNPIVSEPRSRSYGGSRPSYQNRPAPSYRGNYGGGSQRSYSAPSHSSGGRSYSGGGGHSSGGGGGGFSGGGSHGGGGGGHSGGGGGGHRH
jgi:Family of unknown function (DUF6600)/FecR protein